MKITIDQEKCIGCGTCVSLCEQVFELGDDGKAKVKSEAGCDKCNCEEIAEACPVQAIVIK